jgi:serine/threonine protein phosphatase PrpC
VFNEQGEQDEKYVKNPWGNGLHPTNVRYEVAMYMTTPREVVRDSTCIAMTRALGDLYAHPFGLTHVPSITTYELPANRKCVVAVASDGVWDCWTFNDFSDYIRENITKEIGMKQVLDESVSRAIANFGAKHYDDASLVSWVIEPEATQSVVDVIASAVVDVVVDAVVDAVVEVVADAIADAIVETKPVQIIEGSFGIKKVKLE